MPFLFTQEKGKINMFAQPECTSGSLLVINEVFDSRFLPHKLAFLADRRSSYLLKTLTYCLLLDSRMGIPAYGSLIPGRFITLNLNKPHSQEDTSKKHRHTNTHKLTTAGYLRRFCPKISFVYGNLFSPFHDCVFCCFSHCQSSNILTQT